MKRESLVLRRRFLSFLLASVMGANMSITALAGNIPSFPKATTNIDNEEVNENNLLNNIISAAIKEQAENEDLTEEEIAEICSSFYAVFYPIIKDYLEQCENVSVEEVAKVAAMFYIFVYPTIKAQMETTNNELSVQYTDIIDEGLSR